jgi:hypothetical protein
MGFSNGFLFFCFNLGFDAKVKIDVFLFEAIHAAFRINDLLRAGKKRMAQTADIQPYIGLGGSGLKHCATGARDFYFIVFWMYV